MNEALLIVRRMLFETVCLLCAEHADTASQSRKSPKPSRSSSPKPSRSSSPRPSITVTRDAETVSDKATVGTYTTQVSQSQHRSSLDLGTRLPRTASPKSGSKRKPASAADMELDNGGGTPMDRQRMTIAGLLANGQLPNNETSHACTLL